MIVNLTIAVFWLLYAYAVACVGVIWSDMTMTRGNILPTVLTIAYAFLAWKGGVFYTKEKWCWGRSQSRRAEN